MSNSPARPKVDFSMFVTSLGGSAMVSLGQIDDPSTGKSTVNLEAARYSIDVLGILKEKTAGNCTPDESQLLDALLFELRTKFAELDKAG